MFKPGEWIVYGNTGVCEVAGTTVRDFAGAKDKTLYYVLKPLYQGGVIYSPADEPKVFMRPVISREEAHRLIDMIPSIQAEAYHSKALNEPSGHYAELLHSHSCRDLIELTMSIYAKKQTAAKERKKVGSVDEKYMKRAEELLFGELSVALDIPKQEVTSYIASRMEAVVAKS